MGKKGKQTNLLCRHKNDLNKTDGGNSGTPELWDKTEQQPNKNQHIIETKTQQRISQKKSELLGCIRPASVGGERSKTFGRKQSAFYFWWGLPGCQKVSPVRLSVIFLCPCRARSKLRRHKNVLSLIGYSHMLENRWEGKLGVYGNKQQHKQNPNKNKPKDTQTTTWNSTLSEIPKPLSTAPQCHSKFNI